MINRKYRLRIKVKLVKVVNTKIKVLFPRNQQVNIAALKFQLMQHLNIQSVGISSYCSQDCFLNVEANGKLIKYPLRFIFLGRNAEYILDEYKVADIICPVLSCRDCNSNTRSLDPHSNANSFDGQVCFIQYLYEISQSKKNIVKKDSQDTLRVNFLDLIQLMIVTLMRSVVVLHEQAIEWRDIYGYMLPDDLADANGELSITSIIYLLDILLNIQMLFIIIMIYGEDKIVYDDLLKDIAGMQLQKEEKQVIEQESDVSYEDLDKEFEDEAHKK